MSYVVVLNVSGQPQGLRNRLVVYSTPRADLGSPRSLVHIRVHRVSRSSITISQKPLNSRGFLHLPSMAWGLRSVLPGQLLGSVFRQARSPRTPLLTRQGSLRGLSRAISRVLQSPG